MARKLRDDELEAALRDIGRRLDHPTPHHMAVTVRERIHAQRALGDAHFRVARFGLAPTLATAALLLLVVALGVPTARAAAGEFLQVLGLDIFRVGAVATAVPSPEVVLPGERVTLEEARRRVTFTLRAPASARLGAPDDVYLDRSDGTDRVSLVYRARAGMPASRVAGITALVVEFRGTVDAQLFGKAAGPDTRIEPVSVGGAAGYWLEGAPHLFFYRDGGGAVRDETLRLAGNTLIWEDGGVTLRLEAEVSRDEALQIAASFR